ELREQYLLLWDEFKAQNTPEAILANDIDKIEMVLQALEYEEKGWDPNKLEVFWVSAEREIKTPRIRDLFLILKEKRLRQ
ncbi:HD domain-containing protein, partial [Candidatus Bathyarchaeota archaeon]|nr:HD domain-containing protein [Candidatus Bathyarchaeota archaeon]